MLSEALAELIEAAEHLEAEREELLLKLAAARAELKTLKRQRP